MSETLLYFAYGSNMSSKRLQQRVPSARALSTAKLTGHRLKFHKIGQDGSGKCDIEKTGNEQDFVMGVLYKVPVSEIPALDKAEGLGAGYEKKDVAVTNEADDLVTAFTYYATHIDENIIPFDWYKDHVLLGAKEHGLTDDYVQKNITTVESQTDPNQDRAQKERLIHTHKPD